MRPRSSAGCACGSANGGVTELYRVVVLGRVGPRAIRCLLVWQQTATGLLLPGGGWVDFDEELLRQFEQLGKETDNGD